MKSLRSKGIPRWVTVIAVVLGLFATVIGVAALINPSVAVGYSPGADQLAMSWAGRNAGLGIVLLAAVLLRHPAAYLVAFAGQVLREFSDLIAAFPSLAGIAATMIFLAVDLLVLIISWRAVTQRPTEVSARGPS